jgi:hypothetical protein
MLTSASICFQQLSGLIWWRHFSGRLGAACSCCLKRDAVSFLRCTPFHLRERPYYGHLNSYVLSAVMVARFVPSKGSASHRPVGYRSAASVPRSLPVICDLIHHVAVLAKETR